MKKILAVGVLSLMMTLAFIPVFAQTPGQITDPGFGGNVGGQVTSISGWVGRLLMAVRWIYNIVFVIAVLFILLSAFNFITSKGDAEKVKTAKSQLLYAAIGIGVALLSFAIVQLIQNSLVTGLN